MYANWRMHIEGKYYEMAGCTTCTARRFAHKVLEGRGGEVIVEKMVDGAYREFITFTVPKGVRRGGITTDQRRRRKMRNVSSRVRPSGRDPQHRKDKLRRPGRPIVPNVLRKPGESESPSQG
jgi:hypothetical protein